MLSKSAVIISWEQGCSGGSKHWWEIWCRSSNSSGYDWKTIRNIPVDVTTYTVYGLEPQQSYLFSMRGVNKMGFGVFSAIFRSTSHQHVLNGKGRYLRKHNADNNPITFLLF